MIPPYPLAWPEHLPRWKGSRDAGQFKTALPGAMKNVRDSLRRFGDLSRKPVKDVVISSNVTLGVNKPADPGVAVWFSWEDQQICIPVDRYASVEANVQAIHHVLEARCTELRHGTLALVRATMKGFQALPAPSDWRRILRINPSRIVTAEQVDSIYRALCKENATNEAAIMELNIARDRAKQELGL